MHDDHRAAIERRFADWPARRAGRNDGARDPPLVDAWQAELRRHEPLGETATVPAHERDAVELLDALHPEGIQGLIEQTSALLSDSRRKVELGALLGRFRDLSDDSAEIEDLAAAIAGAVPRSQSTAPTVDVQAMEDLIGAP